jgi:hypothetical protein
MLGYVNFFSDEAEVVILEKVGLTPLNCCYH